MSLWTMNDEEAGKPKYLSDALVNAQTTSDKDATVGVDRAEAANPTNRAKGIKTPGWNKVITYTDGQGNVRNKVETLVAAGGDMSGDADGSGADIGTSGGGGGATYTVGVDYVSAKLQSFGDNALVVSANDPTLIDLLLAAPVGTLVTVVGSDFTSPATFKLTEYNGGIGGPGAISRYFYITELSDPGFLVTNSISSISF